ncbi:hypothetical protein BH11PAT1_BH11PAT1_3980 [soil metagenome]
MNRASIVSYLQTRPRLCVLATSTSGGKPECAVLAYAVKEDLSLVLSTHKSSRKCKNIEENNQVSLVFGWAYNEINIQCDGTAQILEKGEKFLHYENFFFSVNPHAEKFKGLDTVFISVKPTWVRITDFTQTPVKIEEEMIDKTQENTKLVIDVIELPKKKPRASKKSPSPTTE